MSDDEHELLVTRSHQHGAVADPRLAALQSDQLRRSASWLRRVAEWARLALLRQPNQLEHYVLSREPNDCSLVAKFSVVVDVDVRGTAMSVPTVSVHTVHMPHPLYKFVKKAGDAKVAQLAAEVAESPMFVFVHGLGGQMANFEPLMGLLSQCSEVRAIDLPGFGNSRRARGKSIVEMSDEEQARVDASWRAMAWSDYETDNLVELLRRWLGQVAPGRKVVLVGHSMGTHLVVKLARVLEAGSVEGMVLLSPPGLGRGESGGRGVASDARGVASDARGVVKESTVSGTSDPLNLEEPSSGKETTGTTTGRAGGQTTGSTDKKNTLPASQTVSPSQTVSSSRSPPSPPAVPPSLRFFARFPRLFDLFRVWDRLRGLDSHSVTRQLTPRASQVARLRQFRWNLDVASPVVLRYVLGFHRATLDDLSEAVRLYNDTGTTPTTTNQKTLVVCGADDAVTPPKHARAMVDELNSRCQRSVSSYLEVPEAGHQLLLSRPEWVCGQILQHIEHQYPERLHLSPAWVLKVKAKVSGDKWGLKNEEKWRQTMSISHNVTRTTAVGVEVAPFLAMKTLKEGDSDHSPQALEHKFYGHPRTAPVDGNLVAVVDISSDVPVYQPSSFDRVQYFKCPTVSKVVPDTGAIRRFIACVDKVLEETTVDQPMIGVHCHYGQNRTIFCCCAYLVERMGWSVAEALDAFAVAKPPGIKHPHFIDALYVRYES
ncbi:hypothetical protein DICA1_B06414 [Diutina catenulata]